MKKIRYILIFLLLFSFTNIVVNAESSYSYDYELYLNLTEAEKAEVGSIPREYVTKYDVKSEINEASYNKLDGDIPVSYDLRDYLDIPVYDQGSYGTCYIFAAMTALETTLMEHNYYYDFSKMHVEYMTLKSNGGTRSTFNAGGNFTHVADYLLKDEGPVLTSDVSYKTYTDSEVASWSNVPVIKTVNSVVNYPAVDKVNNTYTTTQLTEFRNQIKEHLMEEGALSAVIYAGTTGDLTITESTSGDDYVLYYNPTSTISSSNHGITIIGWDDNYSKTNFPADNRPENDGAYLVLNSWGDTMTYIYVSYEDIWIEYEISGFNYDDITDNTDYSNYNLESTGTNSLNYSSGYKTSDYNYALLGGTYDTGVNNYTVYLGNIYTRTDNTSNETINEVVLPMFMYNSIYPASATVYINPNEGTFDSSELVELGTISNITSTGLVKVVSDTPVTLTGSSYAVVIKMTSAYIFRNLFTTNSYISNSITGTYKSFTDLAYLTKSAVFPMIVKTDTQEDYSLSFEDLEQANILTLNSDAILRLQVDSNTTLTSDNNLDVEILKNNTDVTSLFDITGTSLYNNEAILRIKPHSNIALGTYTIKINYQDSNTLYNALTITSQSYTVNSNLFSETYNINYTYINQITENTPLTTYLDNFILDNKYTINIYDSNNNIITSGNITTDSITRYFDSNSNLIEEFHNVVSGDNNDDGIVGIGDIVKSAKYLVAKQDALSQSVYVEPSTFSSDYQFMATDVNDDGSVSIGDIVLLARYYIQQMDIKSGIEVEDPIKL